MTRRYECEPDEVEALIGQLNPNDEAQAKMLADEIIRCGDGAIEPLARALSHAAHQIRPVIAWTLAHLVDAERLVTLVAPTIPGTSQATNLYLSNLIVEQRDQVDERTFIEALISAIEEPRRGNRVIEQCLAEFGDKAVEPLLTELQRLCAADTLQPGRITGVMRLLQRIDRKGPAQPVIEAYCQVRDVEIAAKLAQFLPQFDRHTRETCFLAILTDDGAPVAAHRNVTAALTQTRNPIFLQPMLRMINSPDKSARQNAVNALGSLKLPEAVEPLLTHLKQDDSADVRIATLRVLKTLNDGRAVEPMIAALRDDLDEGVRREAATSLVQFEHEAIAPALVAALDDPDHLTVKRVVASLRRMGSRARMYIQMAYARRPEFIRRQFIIIEATELEINRAQEADATKIQVAQSFFTERKLANPCPVCGRPPGRLDWIYLRRPQPIYVGWLIRCPKCNIQVEFLPERLLRPHG